MFRIVYCMPLVLALVVVIILSYCNLIFIMYHQRYHIGDELKDRDGIYFQWQTD